jgi:hypothetical protein
MSNEKMNLEELLQSESDAIEANPDAPLTSETKVTRGHDRVRKLQIRLNEDEYRQVEEAAEVRGIPISTMARAMLLDALDARQIAGENRNSNSSTQDIFASLASFGFPLVSTSDDIDAKRLQLLIQTLFSRIELDFHFPDFKVLPVHVTYSAEAIRSAQ